MQLFGYTGNTGLITGTVDNDVNGDGSVLKPIAGVKVFIDLKNDGTGDPGDPTTVSAADGSVSFPYVAAGEYDLRFVEPPALDTPDSYQNGPTSVSGGQVSNAQVLYHQSCQRTGRIARQPGQHGRQGVRRIGVDLLRRPDTGRQRDRFGAADAGCSVDRQRVRLVLVSLRDYLPGRCGIH
jgi:hypothetical protein